MAEITSQPVERVNMDSPAEIDNDSGQSEA